MAAEPAKPTTDRIREVTGDQPVTSGAKLVKALKASGTPDAKLQPARDALRTAGRDVPAADLVAALEAAEVSPATVEKAKSLTATGKLPTREATRPIEDAILDRQNPDGAAAPSKTWKQEPPKK